MPYEFPTFEYGNDTGPEASPYQAGPYQSLFAPESQTDWSRTIGNIAYGVGTFGSSFLGRSSGGTSAPAPHGGIRYNPVDFRTTETPGLRTPGDRGYRPLDMQAIEARLAAANKAPVPYRGVHIRLQDYTHPSIGGKIGSNAALKAFSLGYKHGRI